MNKALSHLPQLIVGFIILALGVFVFLKRKNSAVGRVFLALMVVTSGWLLTYFISYSFGHERAYWILKIGYSFVILMPPCAYHFASLYAALSKGFKYAYASYFFALFCLVVLWTTDWFMTKELYEYPWGFYPRAGPFHPVFSLYILLSVAGLNWNLYEKYKRSRLDGDKAERLRSQYTFFAMVLFCLSACDFIPNYGFDVFPVGYLFIGLYSGIMAYGILRHQLLDIRIVIKKTIFYSMSVFTVSAIYVILIFVIHHLFFAGRIERSSFAGSVALVFLIALTLKPLEGTVRKFLDRLFFKGTITEIAEQKQKLETELERQERLKSVGILAAGMAHEIKNPITAIQTFADYLPTRYEDPEFRGKFQRIITQEVGRIKDIVTNLLLFSKPQEPSPKETDILKVLKDILELLSHDLLRYRIKVNHNLDGIFPKGWVDPEQMKQVFLNILMNAIDAMKETGGDLTVQTKVVSGHIEITIEDTGPGIPEAKIKHIFDPFYTDKEGGTGLGLAVTHSIIQKNHGKISVQSRVGQGTKFILELRAAHGEERAF